MDEMGIKNLERLEELASKGRFLKDGTLQTGPLALMEYMAKKATNREDPAVFQQGKAYWCYWAGWDNFALRHGMILPSDAEVLAAVEDGADLDEATKKRVKNARNTLSRWAKFLKDQELIKLIRPAVSYPGRKRNAMWLLLLGGTDAENAAAEAQARTYFRLPPA
ncbi:DEK C-terminal domain-containing protein [Bifidobacterium tissieri]|uniref:Uncharacterized protein n=1 Tax=Bifidobacterium tissieri TaxID=1630162 RepID=A0A5M9ZNW9_9BIFI|nr:DEK C-terminal domain-containing protein [Bifidobacterium tissieri]KAA8829357.1 hypothetical protein EM849_11175 [Bifidobacterium tissieri]KAA8831669.1 hypothetical protein EMO89_02810 [Bifidobacterium tissieri]